MSEKLDSNVTTDGIQVCVEFYPTSKRGKYALSQWTEVFAYFGTLTEAKAALEVCGTEPGARIREICKLVKNEYARERKNEHPNARRDDNILQRCLTHNVYHRLEGCRPIVTKHTEKWVKNELTRMTEISNKDALAGKIDIK